MPPLCRSQVHMRHLFRRVRSSPRLLWALRLFQRRRDPRDISPNRSTTRHQPALRTRSSGRNPLLQTRLSIRPPAWDRDMQRIRRRIWQHIQRLCRTGIHVHLPSPTCRCQQFPAGRGVREAFRCSHRRIRRYRRMNTSRPSYRIRPGLQPSRRSLQNRTLRT